MITLPFHCATYIIVKCFNGLLNVLPQTAIVPLRYFFVGFSDDIANCNACYVLFYILQIFLQGAFLKMLPSNHWTLAGTPHICGNCKYFTNCYLK